MQNRTLGATPVTVSAIGFGGWVLGTSWWGTLTVEEGRALVRRALDRGITFFDTADSYGDDGVSETLLADALAGLPRESYVLGTKFGYDIAAPREQHTHSERPQRWDAAFIRSACEASLRRLRTDVIDLYQLHEPDPVTPIEETLGALSDLVVEGKVRWIGSSNFSADQIEAAEEISRGIGIHRFVSVQNEYSLAARGAEDDVLPVCEKLEIGFLPYFPLASGLLTGKYRRGEEATEGRLAGRTIPEERWDRVEALEGFAEARDVSLLDVAIGGLLAMPAVTSVIAGATKPEQVRANVAAGEWQPGADDVEELRALR
jgi:aryl-alcohol dehydrogenase-like predicted oxidoreductase